MIYIYKYFWADSYLVGVIGSEWGGKGELPQVVLWGSYFSCVNS